MDPQRLARLSDRRAVFLAHGCLIGGTAARSARVSRTTVGPGGVLITRTPGAELAAELVGLDLPAIELPARGPVVAVAAGDATVAGDATLAEGEAVAGGDATADEVGADPAAGSGAGSRPSGRRRPAFVLAAALMGVVSLGGLLTSGELLAHAAAPVDAEPTSVADQLGLLRAQESALTGDEAADRLQEMGASRALREDAQAAAAQAQAATEQAARDAAAAAAEAARPDAVVPVAGARLTSGFGARWGTMHAGIDLAAPMRTPEYAAMDGVVLQAGAASGYGLAVYLQHPNGDVTVYGHMDSILVQEGQSVRAGDTIALLGNRGQSTGPHLHFEVRVGGMDGTPVDPVGWLRERGAGI